MADERNKAHSFLKGGSLSFEEADRVWRQLKQLDELSLARTVLEQVRDKKGLLDALPSQRKLRRELCQQEALLTSKDPELSSAIRHDRALEILSEEFDLEDEGLDGDAETLGIAGGICKRRWAELGQHEDLRRAADLYRRGAGDDLGKDAYAHINAAFVDDLLASIGDNPDKRQMEATVLRKRIVEKLPDSGTWWNAASRAEALFGLGRYAEAKGAIETVEERPAPWKMETTARQLATLAHLREKEPLKNPDIHAFFSTLLPGASDAIRSAFVGKVGLALSGGGFRASFYHLGVLARLAELNVLRHLDVLSCVSGGSIVGACYWLALRTRLQARPRMEHQDYIEIVRNLITHFENAVAMDLRGKIQPSKAALAFRFLVRKEKGAMDPDETAKQLDEHFYQPLGSQFMDELPFEPADHDPELTGSAKFHPGRHNWMRAHKVPALVLNATTVNTGHLWHFTPTWMGESPWAVNEAADSVPRLEWSWYQPKVGWRMSLARAVAASAAVPGLFAPLRIRDAYEDLQVELVDGGVHDNQGSVALLAMNCNVLLVSDAAGQLLLERHPKVGLKGLASYAARSMSTLMERIRQAHQTDLAARCRSGLLRGLMFLHMKAGLDGDTIRLSFSQEPFEIRRSPLSPSGVRKDFQEALAELRTDLDAFSLDESRSLMACGYQMAQKAFQRDLAALTELWDEPAAADWPFEEMLGEITSTDVATERRQEILDSLRRGSKIQL